MAIKIPTGAGGTDRPTQQAFKLLKDHADLVDRSLADLNGRVIATPPGLTLDQIQRALSATGTHPLNLTGLVGTPAPAPTPYVRPVVVGGVPIPPPPPVPVPPPGPPPPPGTTCYTDITGGQVNGIPPAPNLRWWRGDFIGIDVPGLTPGISGSINPLVFPTPFFDRYPAGDQATALAAYHARNYSHWLLWAPDSLKFGGVGGGGQTIPQFVNTCLQIKAAGFYPCVSLLSKGIDHNPAVGSTDGLIAALIAANAAPIMLGFELDSVFDTVDAFNLYFQHVAGLTNPAGVNLYAHLSIGSSAVNLFFNSGVVPQIKSGYLTGYCFQADPTWDCPTLQNALAAILQVFSTTINGRTGQPGDLVALEYAATNRYGGTETEAQAQLQGVEAISTRGPLAVQGFGNGGPNV